MKNNHQNSQILLFFFLKVGNFSVYRQKMQASQAPYVPYLGCTTKDLVFLIDGNQVRKSEGEVSFRTLFYLFFFYLELC